MKRLAFILGLAALSLVSCKKDETTVTVPSKYGTGVFISNEGVFQSGAGTVSHYKRDSKVVQNDAFITENGFPVGNVLQSITHEGEKLYLVVNNSGKVEVANTGTLKSEGTISGFNSPRYLEVINSNTAYVTDWFDNNIKVVDLNSLTIVDSINTGTGPENMAVTTDGKVFVTNTGGWGTDSTVSVINSNDNSLIKTLTLDYLPQSVQIDKNGKVWVLCSGKSDWNDPTKSTAGALYRINPSDYNIEDKFVFSTNMLHPAHLNINGAGDKLYYVSDRFAGEVFAMDITASALPSSSLISKTFYSLGVDPTNSEIYGGDALDFNQSGWVYRYNSTGTIIDSLQVGIIPGNFEFR